MAAPTNPNAVGSQGNIKVVWVETLTNPDSPSLAAINAGTSLDVSYFLYQDGWTPGVTANRVTAKRRLASRTSTEPSISAITAVPTALLTKSVRS